MQVMGKVSLIQTDRGSDADGHVQASIPWSDADGLQQPFGRDDGEPFGHNSLYPVCRNSLHRPVRLANEQFASELRMEIHFSNSSAVGAAICI